MAANEKPVKTRRKAAEKADACTIPPALPVEALPEFVLNQPAREAEDVRRYVEWQARDEKVLHLEMMKAEFVGGRKYTAWDVRTDKARWWVITNPTNLYSQDLFPSLDYTFSFHIGLMLRVMSKPGPRASKAELGLFASAWRKWTHAAEACDRAEEPEDLQAVGMRCREALLAFVRSAGSAEMVSPVDEAPKRADFVGWSALIARAAAPGGSREALRDYLKSTARATWQYVNWLTHAAKPSPADAHLAVEATEHILLAFCSSLLRHAHGFPDACPSCGSYRVVQDHRPEIEGDWPYVMVCASCDWEEPSTPPALRRSDTRPS
jgi:hypothetical protein